MWRLAANPLACDYALQAEDLQLVQEQLSKLDIPYVKQIIVEGGVQVEQASGAGEEGPAAAKR